MMTLVIAARVNIGGGHVNIDLTSPKHGPDKQERHSVHLLDIMYIPNTSLGEIENAWLTVMSQIEDDQSRK